MNPSPEKEQQGFDIGSPENESLGDNTKKSSEEDSNDIKVVVPETFDIEAEHEREVREEDIFLEKLAIRGVGWKRLKYMWTFIGIIIAILTRLFLVRSLNISPRTQ